MPHKSTRSWLVPTVLVPLLAAGCGGTGDTTNGLFGGTGTSTLGGTTTPGASSVNATPGVATGNLQPNAAPSTTQTAQAGASLVTQAATPAIRSLAPLSGSYSGSWTAVPAAPPVSTGATPTTTAAVPAKNVPARTGVVMLKISYPAHLSKTILGNVSGTWADPALGGAGKVSGTIDRIGQPSEPNAVHVTGKVQFQGGRSIPLVVELAEDAVGHIAGTTTTDTISLKKSH